MGTKHKRKFSAEFKAKVCLESIKERSTTEMISKKFMLNPTQINNWKKDFINKAHIIFETNEKTDTSNTEELIQSLYEKIGKQEIALDFYKKKCKIN